MDQQWILTPFRGNPKTQPSNFWIQQLPVISGPRPLSPLALADVLIPQYDVP